MIIINDCDDELNDRSNDNNLMDQEQWTVDNLMQFSYRQNWPKSPPILTNEDLRLIPK